MQNVLKLRTYIAMYVASMYNYKQHFLQFLNNVMTVMFESIRIKGKISTTSEISFRIGPLEVVNFVNCHRKFGPKLFFQWIQSHH